MTHQEYQVLEIIRANGHATILLLVDKLKVPVGSAWKLIERMEHKKLVIYNKDLRAWEAPVLTGSKMHRWNVSRGTLSFKDDRCK